MKMVRETIANHILRLLYTRILSEDKIEYRVVKNEVGELEGVIVDLGGGPGYIEKVISQKGGGYIIDVDIDFYLLREGSIDIDKVMASADDKIFRDNSIDHVIIHDAFHHFANQDRVLKNYIEMTGRCIHIIDYDSSRMGGKLLNIFEKLIGFKSRFPNIKNLIKDISQLGPKEIDLYGPKGITAQFYLKICK
jgi:SAM-dependent methyltransferase